MELIYKQKAIDKILGQPPDAHYPSWYASMIQEIPPEKECDPVAARRQILEKCIFCGKKPRIEGYFGRSFVLCTHCGAITMLPYKV